MKIEVIYPEFSNIYGDSENIKYFKDCNKKIEVIETSNDKEPYFVKNKVDMIYIGSMPEIYQKVAIKKLSKYKDRIKELIEDNVIFLITGNAIEMFGDYIEENNEKIKGLGIFPVYFKRDYEHRHNSLFLGEYKDMLIAGNRSQFTFMYGENKHPFIKVIKGFGSNPEIQNEGINYKNFYATYLLGPFLILNPYFAKYLLKKLNLEETLKFEKEIIEAYNFRIEKLSEKDARVTMSDHG